MPQRIVLPQRLRVSVFEIKFGVIFQKLTYETTPIIKQLPL